MGEWIIRAIELLASFLAVTIVLTLHEFSHAFVAYKCGDPTPKYAGRLTLNPICHFDLLGLLLFAFAGFGWAKPVPINPNNFNHYRRGLTLTALAGVVINYVSVFIFFPFFMLVMLYVKTPFILLDGFLGAFAMDLCMYSLGFCVFNLIPLPPLDGWRVVEATNRRRGKVFRFFQQYGYIILLVMIVIHFLANVLYNYEMFVLAARIFGYIDILGYIMTYVTNFIAQPIYLLWGLVF